MTSPQKIRQMPDLKANLFDTPKPPEPMEVDREHIFRDIARTLPSDRLVCWLAVKNREHDFIREERVDELLRFAGVKREIFIGTTKEDFMERLADQADEIMLSLIKRADGTLDPDIKVKGPLETYVESHPDVLFGAVLAVVEGREAGAKKRADDLEKKIAAEQVLVEARDKAREERLKRLAEASATKHPAPKVVDNPLPSDFTLSKNIKYVHGRIMGALSEMEGLSSAFTSEDKKYSHTLQWRIDQAILNYASRERTCFYIVPDSDLGKEVIHPHLERPRLTPHELANERGVFVMKADEDSMLAVADRRLRLEGHAGEAVIGVFSKGSIAVFNLEGEKIGEHIRRT